MKNRAVFVCSFLCALLVNASAGAAGAEAKGAPAPRPSDDYSFLIATGSVHWSVNGKPVEASAGPELFLLPADADLRAADGRKPSSSGSPLLEAGRAGRSFRLAGSARLRFPAAGAIRPDEGTIELWICLVRDGSDAELAAYSAPFEYSSASGDVLRIGINEKGVVHGGAIVGGAWESAYRDEASIRTWKKGDWHHLALAYSASASTMRFYVDGELRGDTNEGHYHPPVGAAKEISLGSRLYRMDSVRVWGRALDADMIASLAAQRSAPAPNESWLRVSSLRPGDSIGCESAGRSAAFTYRGPPLSAPSPASGLLPAGSKNLLLSLSSTGPATCRYSIGSLLDYEAMKPCPGDQGGTAHSLRIDGLSPDTSVLNDVYLRCDLAPLFYLKLQYRSLPATPATFPRIANLWDTDPLTPAKADYISRLKLLVPGRDLSREQLANLHRNYPFLLVLATIQPLEYFVFEPSIPEEYYLKDVDGHRVSMWPDSFRLNLTRPDVVEFDAQKIYRTMRESGFMYDGEFIDSFNTYITNPVIDNQKRSIPVDANGDGKVDEEKAFQAAWRRGLLDLAARVRELMPHAIQTGHLGEGATPDLGRSFNGDNIAFAGIDVIEGKLPFSTLLERYSAWFSDARKPGVSVIDVGACNQQGYGYGVYSSFDEAARLIPAGVLDFAKTWYPAMRFGLALSLMDDGYFERHFSDVLYCLDWWYDEFGVDLGGALGPRQYALPTSTSAELIANGGFEAAGLAPWNLYCDSGTGAKASMAKEPGSPSGAGSSVLHVDVTSRGDGQLYKVNLFEEGLRVVKGRTYELSFKARADTPRSMAVTLQRRAGEWEILGLWAEVPLGTEWKEYNYRATITGSRTDAGLQFFLAGALGSVWLDEVSFREAPADVYLRYFEKGAALLNGTSAPVTVKLPAGYSRIAGTQAPRWQYILDEESQGAGAVRGGWKAVACDSPAWQEKPPFYHAWGGSYRESRDREAQYEWKLSIPEDGEYSIAAWWTAAPGQKVWNDNAVYEVVTRGKVLNSTVLDQTKDGDAWHPIATVELRKGDDPALRLVSKGSGALCADAIMVSSTTRYNDGSPAKEVFLGPFDGIVLAKRK